MRRSFIRGVAVVVAAGAVVAFEGSSALASERGEYQQVVDVSGNGSVVHLSTSHLSAGSIKFRVGTTNPSTPDGGGSDIAMFKPRSGKTSADVLKDLGEEFGEKTAAQGTRDLVRDATFYGLADVVKGTSVTVTETLTPGTYYLADLGAPPTAGPPKLTTLTVGRSRPGVEHDSDLRSQVTVQAVEPDRFVAPRYWPHAGTFTFTNRSDTIHFVELQPVKKGTTDKQVQAYFDSHSQQPPSFALMGKPTGGVDVLSPGKSLQLSYNLPRGTYVLLCFVADDKTGMPHALMGMHEVVVLK